MAIFVFWYILLKILNKLFHYNPLIKISKIDSNLNKNSVKFLHFDVYWRSSLFRLFKNEFNYERALSTISEMKDFDVVCITEAFTSFNSPVKWFINKMKELGYINIIRLPSVGLSTLEICDGGVILFSKLPILDYDTRVFSISTGQDMLIAKGAIYAKIQTTENDSIYVVGTNLQSYEPNSISECQSVRMSQLREIMSMLSRKMKENSPIIILGNLNIDGRDESVAKRMRLNEYNRMLNTLNKEGYTMIDLIYNQFN